MQPENLIGEITAGQKIYRTITYPRFVQMMSGTNALVHPRKWEDTFEDLLGKAEIISGFKGAGRFDSRFIFGQCWTRHSASDGIWRIYSKGTDGIRIRTTIGKLLSSVQREHDPDGFRAYVGRVQYLPDAKLIEFGKRHFQDSSGSAGRDIAGAYLVKRKAFEHEREIRLIHNRTGETDHEADIFPYAIEPNDFISQVMLHPQLDRAEYKALKKVIRSLGFKNEIKHSMMYRQPEGFQFHFRPRNGET